MQTGKSRTPRSLLSLPPTHAFSLRCFQPRVKTFDTARYCDGLALGKPPFLAPRLPPSPTLRVAGVALFIGTLAVGRIFSRASSYRSSLRMAAFAQPEVLLREGDAVVLTRSKKDLDEKLEALRRGGADKLQVIADFDQTLTRFSMDDGNRSRSTHGILDSEQLSEAFRGELRGVFSQYNPNAIIADHNAKMAFLDEGWRKAHSVLVTHKVTREDIRRCVEGGAWALRGGLGELLKLVQRRRVPLLIFSAGIADVLAEMLRQGVGPAAVANVHVVANRILFHPAGHVLPPANRKLTPARVVWRGDEGVWEGRRQQPVIHSMNKGVVALNSHSPVLDLEAGGVTRVEEWGDVIAGRSNVVLLGDSIGDLQMADGLSTDILLSIAFLNDKVEERKREFLEKFDVVILGDPSLDAVTHFLAPLLSD